jgi:hypothetical protein
MTKIMPRKKSMIIKNLFNYFTEQKLNMMDNNPISNYIANKFSSGQFNLLILLTLGLSL